MRTHVQGSYAEVPRNQLRFPTFGCERSIVGAHQCSDGWCSSHTEHSHLTQVAVRTTKVRSCCKSRQLEPPGWRSHLHAARMPHLMWRWRMSTRAWWMLFARPSLNTSVCRRRSRKSLGVSAST